MTNDAAPDVYHRPMLRGEFLKRSLLLMIVGASCLLRSGGRALAAGGGARSSKPPLTEENLNQFIAELRKGLPPDSEALKTRAARDWHALLIDDLSFGRFGQERIVRYPKLQG